ncbi:MAG TPA: S53 family peptidase [Nevskiaceae bacterium]|nr:S53 family peptidase [Nevskiaceae bacterium]
MLVRSMAPRRLASLLLVPALLASTQAFGWANTKTQAMPLSKAVNLGPVAAATPMNVVVGLKLRNRAQLDSFITHLVTSGDSAYGQLMPESVFAANHAPTPAQVKAVTDYLASQGFTSIDVAGNKLLIRASATAAIVQKAFNTSLVRYQTGGRTVFTNIKPAQVPDALAGAVLNISGLNNLGVFKGHTQAAPDLFNSTIGYTAQNFWSAYDAWPAPWAWGVSIAIIMAGETSTIISDLHDYRVAMGLGDVPVTAIETGAPNHDDSGRGEWAMDTQTSTGMAGNVGRLYLYNAAASFTPELAVAINRFVTENAAIAASASVGICEVLPYLSGDMELIDQSLAYGIAAHGQTLFAASGDAGSACSVAVNAGAPLSGPPMQEYPATSPYAVAVGGTTLLVDSGFNYSQEIAWNGTGGGPSYFEPAPAWQANHAPLKAVGRGVPDIALDADPNTPALVYMSGGQNFIGGTSLSSPLALGVWARVIAQRGGWLGFAAPHFYALEPKLIQAPQLPKPEQTGFHDILAGCNGLYCATPKWDYVSGVGTPDVAKLANLIY